jgi:hypothetical protein
MAWNDWSTFDTAGLIGGALGEKLQPAAQYFSDIAKELRSESAKSLSRVEQMKGIQRQLSQLNAAAIHDLQLMTKGLDEKRLGSVDVIRKELAKSHAFLGSADLNLAVSKNVAAFARSIGTVVGAAELLYKLRNPDLKSYDFGETGVGLVGGIAVGAIATATMGAGLLPVLVGAGGSVLAKYMWQHYVAPQLGWSEKDSPRFWDSVFEAIGLGHQPQTPEITQPAVEESPLRLVMARGNNFPYPLVTHVGRLASKSVGAGKPPEYTLFDIDTDLLLDRIDALAPGVAGEEDRWKIDRTLQRLDVNSDGRLDDKDDFFRYLAVWRDKPVLKIVGMDEIKWVKGDEVIWIDRSVPSAEADGQPGRQAGKNDATADLKAIEARHGRSFTCYFDDLLRGAGASDTAGGESEGEGDIAMPPGLPTLKATLEQALEKDPAAGLADLIDFATLIGPGTLRAQGWDPRPLIVAQLRNGVMPAGVSASVADGNGERLGTPLDDILVGTDVADVIRGADGDDVVGGGAGADQLFGDGGNDQISGGLGNDVLHGGDGDDELIGDLGADTLMGGAGNDRLRGNVGDDVLIGGPGDDVLIGGSGADSFHFERGGGMDRVLDQRNRRPNRLVFGEGLTLTDASAERRGNELHLSWESGESVAMARYFTRRAGRFDLHFADGASIEDAPLRRWTSTIGRDAARLIDAMPLLEVATTASTEVATVRPQPLLPMAMLVGAMA